MCTLYRPHCISCGVVVRRRGKAFCALPQVLCNDERNARKGIMEEEEQKIQKREKKYEKRKA